MKIRVILIILFVAAQHLIPAQKAAIKDKTTYYLSSIYIGKKKNSMAKDRGHIVFDVKLKTASCFTSCNFIKLKYTSKDSELKFTVTLPAKDPCPDHLIGLEQDMKENIPKVDNYSMSGKKLYMFNKKDTLMVFTEGDQLPPPPKKK